MSIGPEATAGNITKDLMTNGSASQTGQSEAASTALLRNVTVNVMSFLFSSMCNMFFCFDCGYLSLACTIRYEMLFQRAIESRHESG